MRRQGDRYSAGRRWRLAGEHDRRSETQRNRGPAATWKGGVPRPIRTDVRGHDDRLRAVEVAIEKLQLAEKLLRQEGDPPSATGDPPE